MTKSFHNPDDEFDTLEQTVAQICPCAVCASGGVCDRAKKLTARIRSIKTAEPVTDTAKGSTLNEKFEAWVRSHAEYPDAALRQAERSPFSKDSFLAGAKAEREEVLKIIDWAKLTSSEVEASVDPSWNEVCREIECRIKERDNG